jgi:hypothetical protein
VDTDEKVYEYSLELGADGRCARIRCHRPRDAAKRARAG